MTAKVTALFFFALLSTPAWSHPPDDDHTHIQQQDSGTKHGRLGQVGNKLSNPTANIWALAFNIQGPSSSRAMRTLGTPSSVEA